MQSHSGRKALGALAVAMAVLVSTSVPVSAASGTIVSGTFRIHTNPLTDLPIPGTDPDPCKPPLPSQDLTIDFAGDGISGTWTIPEQTIKSRFAYAGSWVQLDLQILESSGTYTWASLHYSLASDAPDHVRFVARFYLLDPPNCVKESPVCSLHARTVVVTPQSFVDSLYMPNPMPGESALLNTTSNLPGGSPLGTLLGVGCSSPFSAFIGLHVSLFDLVVLF